MQGTRDVGRGACRGAGGVGGGAYVVRSKGVWLHGSCPTYQNVASALPSLPPMVPGQDVGGEDCKLWFWAHTNRIAESGE